MSGNGDQLFLLEILVQNAKIEKSCLNNNVNVGLEVRFGELPCFSLHPETSNATEDEDFGTHQIVRFNCGKTCLFLMKPEKLVKTIRECPISVGVVRQREVATEPEMIAQSEINLSKDMLDMVHEAINDGSPVPISEFLENSFDLLDSIQDDVGEIEVFVRLTCLGRSVLTQVKMSPDQKFQFDKEPKFVDLACKGCEAGRPGPDMNAFEMLSKCESVTSEDGSGKKELQRKCSQLCSETNTSTPTKVNESCCKASTAPKATSKKHVEEKRKPAPKHEQNFSVKSEKTKGKRTKKGLYAPGGPDISYPGTMVGHVICQQKNRLVPARQGWAWKTALPEGLKPSDRRGWQPGYFRKSYLKSLKKRPKINMLRRLQTRNTKPELATFSKKPTLHILRKKGEYHLTINPPGGKETKKYAYPANPTDSDLELNLNLPETFSKPLPTLKHQAQQFCEEDFRKEEKTEKPKKNKSKKEGKKVVGHEKQKQKQKPKKKVEDLTNVENLVKPWDTWVLKLKCPSKKDKKTSKDGKKKKEKHITNKQ